MVRRILRLLLVAGLAYYTLCAGFLVLLRWVNPPFTAVQAQRRVEALLSWSDYQPVQRVVPLQQIPLDLQRAVVAAEDGSTATAESIGRRWRRSTRNA